MPAVNNYCVANSGISCQAYVTNAYEVSGSVNVANNTSIVHVDYRVDCTSDAYHTFSGSTRDAAGYAKVWINGVRSGRITIPIPNGMSGGDNLGSGSFELTVEHTADGSKTVQYGITMDAGSDPRGANYYWPDAPWDNADIALTTIPRTSNVSLNKSTVTLNGSDGFVIYTNRASSSFSHNLFQNISGSWVQIAGGVGDNYTWIPSTNFYANIGNNSKTYQILCQTWAGSTHIGDSQVNFTLASAGVHQCSLSTGSITLNGSNGVRIYTNRNSGSFLHYVEQKFSGSMAAISSDYNVTDYIDWTPPASYYTTIGSDSKSFIIRVHCKNNDGTYLGYTDVGFTIYSAGADSVSLDNTNMTMGTAYTVSIAKRVSSFTHTVTWAFGSASGTLGTAKAVDISVGWTPSTDLSAQILTSMTGQGTVTCQTYYGDTPIGSTSVAFNLSVPSYNVVLGTPEITETGKDNTGTLLTDKGVDATEVVAIMSIKRLVVSATTSYNAIIKNISVTFGGSTKTVSSGSFDDTFSGMMNGNLTITATDSRDIALASTYSRSYTFQDYFKPSVTSFDGDRDASQTGDTGTLNAAGTFWNKTAGTTANALTGAISISATGATTITPSGNNWTTAFAVSGVDYQNSYNFKIIVTDGFGFTAEKTYTLNASVPVLVKLKHTVRIYRNLVVSNIIKATKGYFTGDLKVGGKLNASGDLAVGGKINASGDLAVGGKINASGGVAINSGVLQLNDAKEYRYTIERANGTVKWVKLGTWSGAYDSMNAIIHIYSSNGYNGGAWQNGEIEVFIKDGWQSDTSTANSAFGVSYLFSHNNFGQTIQARATSSNSIDIWLYTAANYWNFTCSVYVSAGIWTPKSELSDNAPTEGVAQDCVGKQICTKSDLLDWEHPVGSVVIFSEYNYSPANIFGGSWSRIGQGCLYSEVWNAGQTSLGDWNTTGSTTLTANQSGLRSHSHNAYSRNYEVLPGGNDAHTAGNAGGEIGSWGIQNTGDWNAAEGHTHTVIPLSQRVYAWKRIG